MDACVFCEKSITNGDAVVKLGEKGCKGIAMASAERGGNLITVPGQTVHTNCRRNYCDLTRIKASKKRTYDESELESVKALRSTEQPFNFREHCLFCGHPDTYDQHHRGHKLIAVRTLSYQESLTEKCANRNDKWAQMVLARVVSVHDLPAADAMYHHVCSVNFHTGKHIPQTFMPCNDTPSEKRGRRPDTVQEEAFLKVMADLEANDEEQTSVNDLIYNMHEYLQSTGSVPYGSTFMKDKIKQHFGESIMITEINGKSNVVTFTNTASNILHDFHQRSRNDDCGSEKLRVIEAAAKLIKCDIKSIKQNTDTYSTCDEMCVGHSTQFVPGSLRVLLQVLCPTDKSGAKLASLGQALMQATRPRVLICPLQLGLGVQLHHHFASKFLIDSLNSHGFCCSYAEVQRYERSASVSHGTEIPNYTPEQFVQYVADNVDHNVRSIDGKNTFHGMGMMATVTPGTKSNHCIPRLTVTNEELSSIGRVNVEYFTPICNGIRSLSYARLPSSYADDPTSNLDVLWKMSLSVRPGRPGYSGLMQMVQKGSHPGQASMMFLPMIDINPSDYTCVNSTLHFICAHAKKYNITPIITFDQPLWWKSLQIIESEPENSDLRSIVLRLGGFHTEMSFLGSIGHTMAGSGLQEVLELIYAPNAVSHMLSGKAVERAVRGHLLVDTALNAMVVTKTFKVALPHKAATEVQEQEEKETEELGLMEQLGILYDKVAAGTVSIQDTQESTILKQVSAHLQMQTQTMKNSSSRNTALWFQYMEMMDILRKFLKAERTGNWALHLQALYDMLPYLAASGHNLYTKSVHIYLQNMANLEKQHPEVHTHFKNGLHVVRRSNRFWAGLSIDLVIEQVLMKSLKTSGGLTRGRGMTETQRLVWLMSRPICAELTNAMQDFTTVAYATSEQHKEMTHARKERDLQDTLELLEFLKTRNPFEYTPLTNLATGVTADSKVNADNAQAVGKVILESMVGKNVLEHSFKKREQLVRMDTNSVIKISGETIHIDPQLLFQRLVTAGNRNEQLQDIFQFELCSYPPALFDMKQVMRVANKPVLADAIWALLPNEIPGPNGDDVQYVVDGGALLHRIPWEKGTTYNSIFQKYANYITRRYGNATIVFDGYKDGPSTKDAAHQRRTGGNIGTPVHFTSDMIMKSKKEEFLANPQNKQKFIHLLSETLVVSGCKTKHAEGDADVLIVNTGIESAFTATTVLVGDDTDLLVLLCFHVSQDLPFDICFRPEVKTGANKLPRCWDIKVTKQVLGVNVCDHLLFVHALLGCDTTSRVFGLGKGVALKQLRSSHFTLQAEVFNNPCATKEEVIVAGENSLACLYNGKAGDKLDVLRLLKFCQKVGSSTSCVQPQVLPPTSAAAQYHSLRVYHQVQTWKGNELPPWDWGWKDNNAKLVPIMTDKDVAPRTLIEMIRCTCKSGCSSMRCSCRKSGLDCSPACGECRGVCANMSSIDED